jgi:DNA-binding MarR family transcriptional regulator
LTGPTVPAAPGTPGGPHPVEGLDEIVHQRARLGILSVLVEAGRADFGYLKGTLGLTDGNLSRHLQVLEEAGLVQVDKTFDGRRPRTWVSVTKTGRKALAAEVAALRDIIARVSVPDDDE